MHGTILLPRTDKGLFTSTAPALERFIDKCQFEPTTGCVIWVGGKTKGRGHHVDYPSFWYAGRRWFGHRWSAKFIHGQDIEGFHTDHCCPHIPLPNTLCVEHVQSLTPRENRELQHTRRKQMIHLQVGLVDYRDIYGVGPDAAEDLVPFFTPPAWLTQGTSDALPADCPF